MKNSPSEEKHKRSLEYYQRTKRFKTSQLGMGSKITIDSATLMNKGLEVIELNGCSTYKLEQIEVVVHPQSIVHSIVQFSDGSIIVNGGS